MTRILFRSAASISLLALSAASTVEAQVIRGRLLDHASDLPVAGAAVVLVSPGGVDLERVITDTVGHFTMTTPGPGRYEFRAQRVGYETVTSPPLRLERADTVHVDVHIATDAVPLAPLTVTAARRAPIRDRRLDEFYDRQRRGFGTFFGPEEIDALRPPAVSTLLHHAAGVNVRYSRSGSVVTMQNRFRRTTDCIPTIMVDGHRFPGDPDLPVDNLVSTIDLRAVEVYRASQVPPDLSLPMNSQCGVIVIWTDLSVADAR